MNKIKYYLQFLNHGSFKEQPFKILKNCIIIFYLLLLKKKKIFEVKNSFTIFKLNFYPLKPKDGGRGVFIYREKIEPLMEYGLKLIKKGDFCIDAGANQGIYTTAFSSIVGRKGKVLAIEPMKYACNIIVENLKINNLKNSYIYRGVISNKNGCEYLDLSTGVGSASIVRNKKSNLKLKVNCLNLKTLIKKFKFKKIDFIKLDIEGAEELVLRDNIKIIEKFRPIICVECEVDRFDNFQKILKPLNFNPYIFDHLGKLIKINNIRKNQANIFYKI